jgi:hypothetical protein
MRMVRSTMAEVSPQASAFTNFAFDAADTVRYRKRER